MYNFLIFFYTIFIFPDFKTGNYAQKTDVLLLFSCLLFNLLDISVIPLLLKKYPY